MFYQIDPSPIGPEGVGHPQRRPLLEHEQIKDLIMSRVHPVLDAVNGGLHEVALPVLVPSPLPIEVGIGDSVCRPGLRRVVVGQPAPYLPRALSELVIDSPTGQPQQPTLEGAINAPVVEILHTL